MWLIVDPLAEDFPNWTPYHYVHNNPINLIDPTGMSAENYDPPTEGNFANGTVHTDDSGSWTYNDGMWEDNSGGGNNFGGELFIDAKGNNSETYSGNTIDCVNCHHTTVFGSGDPNNSPYDRYTVWGYNRTGGDNEKSMRGKNVNAISFSVTDVPLMGAGGASLNSSSTIFQAAKILQHWTSGAVGGVSVGEDPNVKDFVRVILYNGASDSVPVHMNKKQLNDMRDYKSETGVKFRDSLRKRHFNFNAAKIYD